MAIRYLTHGWTRIKEWRNNPYRNRPNWSEWVAVILTAVIAIVGVLQWNVYRQQKAIMESSSHQTDQLICAANIQAGAATKNAEAAGKFAASADGINRHTDEAVNQFRKLADKTAESVTNSVKNFRDDQRAWVGPIEFVSPNPPFAIGNQPTMGVILVNSGKTPALNFTGITSGRGYNKTDTFVPIYENLVGKPSVAVVLPNSRPQLLTLPMREKVTQHDIDVITSGGGAFYIYGTISYDDVSKRHHQTTYCFFLKPDLVTGATCGFYNSAD